MIRIYVILLKVNQKNPSTNFHNIDSGSKFFIVQYFYKLDHKEHGVRKFLSFQYFYKVDQNEHAFDSIHHKYLFHLFGHLLSSFGD